MTSTPTRRRTADPAAPRPTRPAPRAPHDAPDVQLTRRGVLVLGGLGVAALGGLGWGVHALGGPSDAMTAVADRIAAVTEPADPPRPTATPTCVAAGALPVQRTIGGVPLRYDVGGATSDFHFDSAFHVQLETWLGKHVAESGLGKPAQVWTLGSWIEGTAGGSGEGSDGTVDSASGCSSWHNAGRAFDLTRMLDATGTAVMSARYDLWSALPEAQLVAVRRTYWRTAAGLHRDFDSVLTYLFNGLHHNHIHVDNGLSGQGADASGSLFRTASRVQVQAVQAMCAYVWGYDVPITGTWDQTTREATQAILVDAGVGGRLTDGQTHWHGFLTATLRAPVTV